jgi:hypothetical protein
MTGPAVAALLLAAAPAWAADLAGDWTLETACPDGGRERGRVVLNATGAGNGTLTRQVALAARVWT